MSSISETAAAPRRAVTVAAKGRPVSGVPTTTNVLQFGIAATSLIASDKYCYPAQFEEVDIQWQVSHGSARKQWARAHPKRAAAGETWDVQPWHANRDSR